LDKRKVEEGFFKGLMMASILIVVSSLMVIIITTIIKGAPVLSVEMITQTPKGGYYIGKGGRYIECNNWILVFSWWCYHYSFFDQHRNSDVPAKRI
jgi:ABC-type phosphate transport system permease subunit